MKLPFDIEDAKNLGRLLDRYKDRYYFQVLAGLFITYILYPLIARRLTFDIAKEGVKSFLTSVRYMRKACRHLPFPAQYFYRYCLDSCSRFRWP